MNKVQGSSSNEQSILNFRNCIFWYFLCLVCLLVYAKLMIFWQKYTDFGRDRFDANLLTSTFFYTVSFWRISIKSAAFQL